ncbi:MAG TPA: aminotransferase class V-fold PLP-dependent enzyme [Flavobacteriaceae bacterium]|jgi:selenocysteine lyase/cysteine desulfurase
MALQNQRDIFSIPDHITYLNTAYISPSFKAVERAGLDAVMRKSQPFDISPSDFFDPVTEVKKLFAKLVEVDDYNRIATVPSASYGIANVANNIHLNENDEIIVLEGQFPSNVYAWQILADKYGTKLITINAPRTSKNSVKQWNLDILNAINDKTAVVAMAHIHWSNGILFDLNAIREKTKQHSALLIIDGSQSVGALPFSVKDLQPDALICAGYKWLFGPYACGYAYYGPYFDNGVPIENNWANRLHSEDFSGLTRYEAEYKPLAGRYTMGESGSFIAIPMQLEALKQLIEWTPKAIQDYCKDISSEAVEELKSLGCHIEDESDRAHHLFGIKLPEGLDVETFKQHLKEHHIYVSFRGHYIRISCHLFNTKDDFDKLVKCMALALQKNNYFGRIY